MVARPELLRSGRWKRRAVKHELFSGETSDWPVVLRGCYGQRDLIAWLEGITRPALPDHILRIAGFHDPVSDFAFVVSAVDLQKAMRIGPKPLRNSSRHIELFVAIVDCVPMVREE